MVPIVARWYFDTWGKGVPGNTFKKLLSRLEGELNRTTVPLTMVALQSGRPIGAAQIKRNELNIFPVETFWLSGVYTTPGARGWGLASMLAEKMVSIAETLDINALYLQTEALNGGLYARLGWKDVQTLYNMGINVLVMRRDL